MKKLSICLIVVLVAGLLAACNTNQKKQEKYNRKIYLTEEDYMEDLSKEAVKERRETAPNVESEYLFNIGPEEDKTIYFFDDRQQPKVPGQPSAADYKKDLTAARKAEKAIPWQKTMPQQAIWSRMHPPRVNIPPQPSKRETLRQHGGKQESGHARPRKGNKNVLSQKTRL